MNETITILLATYNGEKYLSHQLDSILNQSYTNWHLIIRDDVSQDNTPVIIEKYRKAYPNKIEILDNNRKNKGSLLNFGALLQAACTAKYIMFCDQDDEWKKDKIEVTFSKMCELEKEYGSNHQIMVYTNLQYVDEYLQIIHSKVDFDVNRIKDFGFPHLLAQNPVYGCTSMINRSLADKVGIIPPEADFHDHWIALIGAAFGKLYYLKETTVLYRQHTNNVSGNFDNDTFRKRFQRIAVNKKNVSEVKAKYAMLLTFKKKYYHELNNKYRSMLDTYLTLFTSKNPLIFFRNFQNGVRCQRLAQSVLLYITILFIKSPSQS